MKKNMKKAFAFACMAALMVTAIPVQAATKKPTLSAKKVDISLGKKGYHKMDSGIAELGAHQVAIKNVKKGAKYVCTTSNKKIVSVNVKSNKINLTGLKAGKATITCKQTLKGKTTTVGKMTVTVHNAKIGVGYDGYDVKFPLDNYKYTNMVDFDYESPYIQYFSTDSNVKYKFSVDKEGFTVSDSKYNAYGGDRILNFNATKPGTYTITLKQTYNKKTVSSSAKAVCVDAIVKESINLIAGRTYNWWEVANYTSPQLYYQLEGVDTDIFTKTEDSVLYVDNEYNLRALKEGTVKVNVYYYDQVTETRGNYLGTCEINVLEYHTEEVDFYWEADYKTYLGAYTEDSPADLGLYIYPDYSVDPVEVTSSDESIVKILSETDESGYTYWYYVPVSAGTATITATSNGITATKKITVYETEEEYDDSYMMDW